MTPQAEITSEAARLLKAAHERDLEVRLIGGIAIRRQVGDRIHPTLVREYKDIDLAAASGTTRAVEELMESLGYAASDEFNALNGRKRLLFFDLENDRQVDVFVGEFSMCHAVPITDRLDRHPDSIPSAELLLTKLQVVELNEKDQRDIVTLLLHQEVADHDDNAINGAVVAHILAEDWGLWRTCQINVGRVRDGIDEYGGLTAVDRDRVLLRLDELWQRVEDEPKPRSWKLRNRIGDRKQWYEMPEEVGGP